jgi:hypothetical protein
MMYDPAAGRHATSHGQAPSLRHPEGPQVSQPEQDMRHPQPGAARADHHDVVRFPLDVADWPVSRTWRWRSRPEPWRICGGEEARPGPGGKGITTLSATASDQVPTPSAGSSPPGRRGPDASAVLMLVNGVLAGIGAVYATTRSIMVTSIAAGVAVALALMVLIFRR